jgi:hypothetical protein
VKADLRSVFVVCLVTAKALASGATTVPQFDAAIATARLATSPGGVAVTRAEIQGATGFFLYDDSVVDATEAAALAARLADPAWFAALTGAASSYAQFFQELNQPGPVPSVAFSQLTSTTAQLFGATGALSNAAAVQEGFIPNGTGVANQGTLQQAYLDAFNASPGTFLPANPREVIATLAGSTVSGLPSQDEVDGAFAHALRIARNSNRFYIASWKSPGRGAPGDLGGYVIAAVSTDRRFVRFIEVTVWVE